MPGDNYRLKDRVRKSGPMRTFGRAMNVLGNGARTVGSSAKSVLEQPLKAARNRKTKAEFRVAIPKESERINEAQSSSAQNLHSFGENLGRAMNDSQQIFNSHLQDSADFLKRCLHHPVASSGNYLTANCFPPRLIVGKSTHKRLGQGDEEYLLVCTGSRTLLNVKLYDFAVYLDPKQAKRSSLAKTIQRGPPRDLSKPDSETALTAGLRDSRDIDMALMVRASRNLPIMLLAKEYERILKRRLQVVGGSPKDPALQTMLATFREQSLPDDIKQGTSVKKGTVIAFTKDDQSYIHARANEHSLVEVQSQKLAQAVFDIYLGAQVVCKSARKDAGRAFLKIVGDEEFKLHEDSRVCSQEACHVGRLL